jgi:hypothetical protein
MIGRKTVGGEKYGGEKYGRYGQQEESKRNADAVGGKCSTRLIRAVTHFRQRAQGNTHKTTHASRE